MYLINQITNYSEEIGDLLMRMYMYYIDLNKDLKKLKIGKYKDKMDLELDLEYFGYSSYKELNDYDFKVFETLNEAESWLEKFQKTLKSLDEKDLCLKKGIPALLYKRRYLIQTLMGEKMQTFRDRDIGVKSGDLMNLYDQTYILTVKVTRVIFHGHQFEYQFEHLSKLKTAR